MKWLKIFNKFLTDDRGDKFDVSSILNYKSNNVMSKYRLKQWYPSLSNYLSKGDVVQRGSVKDHYTKGGACNTMIPKKEVENNPEFWEKVEERNYEILELKGLNNQNIHQVKNGKVCRYNGGFFNNNDQLYGKNDPFQYVKNYPNDWKIHKIERLSDGEVFTIGDRIHGSACRNRIIIGFEPQKEGKYWIRQESNKGCRDGGYCRLDGIEHVKDPLFISEEGEEIYAGDKYYVPQIPYEEGIVTEFAASYPCASKSTAKRFTTRKRAKEWIKQYQEENKKQDSKSDIKQAYDDSRTRRPHAHGAEIIHTPTFKRKLDL